MKISTQIQTLGVALTLLVFGAACQKDFKRLEDWVDYQATQVPPATQEDPVHQPITQEVLHNIARASVTVQNFQLTRIDDKASAGNGGGGDSGEGEYES